MEKSISGRQALIEKLSNQSDNMLIKLQRREIGGIGISAFTRATSHKRFVNFQLQGEFNIGKKLDIVEIIVAQGVMLAHAQSGICWAFSRRSNRKLCLLNIKDEFIFFVMYNNYNESIITMSASVVSSNLSSAKWRATPIEYIRRGQPDMGVQFFETNLVNWNCSIVNQEPNGKIVAFSTRGRIYKVFDAKNYQLLHSICDENVAEIKIGEVILLRFKRAPNANLVSLQLRSMENGAILKTFYHQIHVNKEIVLMDQLNEKIIIKQEDKNLQILDILTGQFIEVRNTANLRFLYKKCLLLGFHDRTRNVNVWNLRGEKVSSFQDRMVWDPDCVNTTITRDADLIISCKDNGGNEKNVRSINITKISTGKCIAKIRGNDPNVRINCRNRANVPSVRNSVEGALTQVTKLFYDEENYEIYTGNAQGLVHVWSN